MAKIVGKLWILVALFTMPWLVVGLIIFFPSRAETAGDIGENECGLSKYDLLAAPRSVLENARALANKMVGEGRDGWQDLVNQLLATYLQVKDKDIVIVFNSGGWGWNRIEKTPGWTSILDGIKSKLDSLGYKSLVLNHRRTGQRMLACIREYWEGAVRYPLKGKDLARRVEFLTANVPNLRVIIAGESNGSVIVDSAMNILHDNPRVYSIQTGSPCWHRPTMLDKTLLLNDNGLTRDTFNRGNVAVVIWATIKDRLGLYRPEDCPGHVLSWLRAPGHDYSWRYPLVRSAVVTFLEENFGVRSDNLLFQGGLECRIK